MDEEAVVFQVIYITDIAFSVFSPQTLCWYSMSLVGAKDGSHSRSADPTDCLGYANPILNLALMNMLLTTVVMPAT